MAIKKDMPDDILIIKSIIYVDRQDLVSIKNLISTVI